MTSTAPSQTVVLTQKDKTLGCVLGPYVAVFSYSDRFKHGGVHYYYIYLLKILLLLVPTRIPPPITLVVRSRVLES